MSMSVLRILIEGHQGFYTTMAPNITSTPTGVLFEDETLAESQVVEELKSKTKYVRRIVWRNVIIFSFLHLGALFGVYLLFTSAKFATILFAIFLYQISGLGITAGAHRLWAHRSYKAKWPLQLLLVIMNTVAFQDAAVDWARDHRVHHKYTETDADPHNAKRGFFFAHMGWLLCRKHPDVKEKGKGIDLSDLESDPILAFQKKHINPAENKGVAMFALGEGWHNYHHVFPWDYKTAELGNYRLNFTTAFIDFFAKIGWAYDLKTVSEETIKKRVERTGDGSHELWGWGDKDQTQEERDAAIVTHHHTKMQ
ncbi:acyl-CoA Delta(11) desaturase isoform X3 [Solenopsis invicta]|uniref:acyl-CoA Delta(11) desaturase isoform X3 n=1 Tax=Solenopsis invicta TaxID=13686 RepID=UPI00193E9139|nr:acyl-CoA Delta(11) desaturase isoform X3 [Solenopsis invicta]